MKFSHNILHTYSFNLCIKKEKSKIGENRVVDPLIPFPPIGPKCDRLAKISIQEGIIKKISYERTAPRSRQTKRAAMSRKKTKKKNSGGTVKPR